MSDYQPKRRGTRGPAPKGNRKQRTMMIEAEILAALDAAAARDGLTASDVVARLGAEHFGLPVPTYCLPQPDQQELQLEEAS